MDFKTAAKLSGLTNAQLGELVGKEPPTVSAYKNGNRAAPPEVIRALVAFLRSKSGALATAADALAATIGDPPATHPALAPPSPE